MIASPSASRQEAIRAAIMTLPGMEAAACSGDERSIDGALAHARPHVLVVDMMLPEDESLALIRRVRRSHPAVAVLAVAISVRQRQLALAAGADGAVLHTAPVAQLAEVVAHVAGRSRPNAMRDLQ